MRKLALLSVALCTGCTSPWPFVPAHTVVEKVATGFGFTEGPASDPRGNIWFTDLRRSLILEYDAGTGRTEVRREDSGGANGLMFDARGRLYVCEGEKRRISRIAGGVREVIVSDYDGGRFNQPNDLVLDGHGGLYFTDPLYDNRRTREQDVEAVYHVDPSGRVRRVIDDLTRPNGLIFSPDGKRLFVADSAARKIVVYAVAADGSLGSGRLFATMTCAPDGMTADQEGRIYAAGKGAIWVWDRTGALITKIAVPEDPTNCTFGGPDRNTLYITARTSLYRIRLNFRKL